MDPAELFEMLARALGQVVALLAERRERMGNRRALAELDVRHLQGSDARREMQVKEMQMG
jgi:hypothetical protein